MPVFRNAAVAAALICAAAAAPLTAKNATTQNSAAKNVTADIEQIANLLQREGYQAKQSGDDGQRYIESSISGWKYRIYFYGCNDAGKECTSVQYYAGFAPRTKPTLEAMNAYARENRFGLIYLDDEKDPNIEMDVNLEKGGMSEELFLGNLEFWDIVLSNFAEFAFKND